MNKRERERERERCEPSSSVGKVKVEGPTVSLVSLGRMNS